MGFALLNLSYEQRFSALLLPAARPVTGAVSWQIEIILQKRYTAL